MWSRISVTTLSRTDPKLMSNIKLLVACVFCKLLSFLRATLLKYFPMNFRLASDLLAINFMWLFHFKSILMPIPRYFVEVTASTNCSAVKWLLLYVTVIYVGQSCISPVYWLSNFWIYYSMFEKPRWTSDVICEVIYIFRGKQYSVTLSWGKPELLPCLKISLCWEDALCSVP